MKWYSLLLWINVLFILGKTTINAQSSDTQKVQRQREKIFDDHHKARRIESNSQEVKTPNLDKEREIRTELEELTKLRQKHRSEGKHAESEEVQKKINEKVSELRSSRDSSSRSREQVIPDLSKHDDDNLQTQREDMLKRHEERRKSFEKDIHGRDGSAGKVDKDQRFKNAMRDQADRLIKRIQSSKADDETKRTLKEETEAIYLEEISHFESRHDIGEKLTRSRDIVDRDERQKFLDAARKERDDKRVVEREAREGVIKKRNDIRTRVDALFGSGEL